MSSYTLLMPAIVRDPSLLVHVEPRSVVHSGCLRLTVTLHVPPPGLYPRVQISHGEDESTARILTIREIEVICDFGEVADRVEVGIEVIQQRLSLSECLPNARAVREGGAMQATVSKDRECGVQRRCPGLV